MEAALLPSSSSRAFPLVCCRRAASQPANRGLAARSFRPIGLVCIHMSGGWSANEPLKASTSPSLCTSATDIACNTCVNLTCIVIVSHSDHLVQPVGRRESAMQGTPVRSPPLERTPTPSPSRRPSMRVSKDLAEAARQLSSCRHVQTVAALAFLCGAVWAVTLVGLGATGPLAHFQRHGGEKLGNARRLNACRWPAGRAPAHALVPPAATAPVGRLEQCRKQPPGQR